MITIRSAPSLTSGSRMEATGRDPSLTAVVGQHIGPGTDGLNRVDPRVGPERQFGGVVVAPSDGLLRCFRDFKPIHREVSGHPVGVRALKPTGIVVVQLVKGDRFLGQHPGSWVAQGGMSLETIAGRLGGWSTGAQ